MMMMGYLQDSNIENIKVVQTPCSHPACALAIVWLLCFCLPGMLMPAVSAEPAPSRQIALSFDDAPRGAGPFFSGAERADQLIQSLRSVSVSGALFFVVTGRLEDNPIEGAERLKRYVAAGHHLASHSHTHPYLHRTAPDEFLRDMDQSLAQLTSFDGVLPLFRFPYLDEGRELQRRDAVREGLRGRNLANGYVTVDNYDWYMAALAREALVAGHDLDRERLGRLYVEVLTESVEFYDRIAVAVLGRSPRHVLLLHENDLAALYIDELVTALRDRGWRIIPAAEAYQDPLAQVEPDTLFLGQGRVAALAHAAGWKPRELVHHTEDEQWLRARFLEEGLLPAPEPN